MHEKGYKRVLVGRSGTPTGILSTRDILAWNNSYFKPAKPFILMIMDNDTSIILGKHVFKENFPHKLNNELIEAAAENDEELIICSEVYPNETGWNKIANKSNGVFK